MKRPLEGMMKRHLFFALTLSLGILVSMSEARAKTYLLATVTSQEEEDNTTKFILTTQGPDDDILTFTQKKFVTKNPQKILTNQVFNLQNYQSDSNLVLEKRQGHVVVQMRSSNFAAHNGGNLLVDFLYNGATGSRKSVNMELVRGGPGWQLVDNNNNTIYSMYLANHKVLFKTVGIDHIEFNQK